MKIVLIVLVVFFISFSGNAQREQFADMYNRLGLQAGITHGTIESENFAYIPRQGFTAGFTTRSNTYKKFLVVYGVNFHQFNSAMLVLDDISLQPEEIDFKATGVQLNLFLGHKIIGEYLSIEAGPVLQINSKWSPEEGKENYFVPDYNLVAKDLEDVSMVNMNVAANLSAGFRSLKFWLQYQYGVSNMLRNLNTEEMENKDSRATNLKGNMRIASAGIVYYF